MPAGPVEPHSLGYYLALAQVGFEMVVPIAVGMALDSYLHWAPWGVAVGAVLGLAGGLTHLVILLMRDQGGRPPNSRQDKP